ncbi:peroxisomal membrane anchor protein conserved region-domain-containing protein [Chlamydoabsidia padenii]|nr:peroxisomal membrane anchor protein conserved region-domain-containing protein [Chlamydoabsidia padenii]
MADNNDSSTAFRQDQLKLAVSFLSSNKVQAADKSKKVAFLKSKGLTDEEITEAFRLTDQAEPVSTTNPVTPATTPIVKTTLSPELAPPTTLIPSRPLEPLILYQPAPTAPKVPTRQVIAMAIIFGVGLTGMACSMVGIVKRILYPVFATFAGYKHSRYKHQTNRIQQIKDALNKDIKEEEDQDELDTLDKPGVYLLAKEQQSLVDRLDRIVSQARTIRSQQLKTALLHHSLKELKGTITTGMHDQQEADMVAGMMGELRRLKGICLNRRHF